MMKLYYAPGACSLSPHIALREAGLPFELEKVDFMAGKKLPDGSAFSTVNPKGYVPALRMDDGELLTEGAVIVQHIADLAPDSRLAPKHGTKERLRLMEWLNFIATELHKGLGPFFGPGASDEYKETAKKKLASRLQVISDAVKDKKFLLGDQFSIADGYALYALRVWTRFAKGELTPELAAYQERILERPAVQEALKAEGLS